MKDDLRFKTAAPIAGGREVRENGKLEESARADSINNFQGCYVICYVWSGVC